MGREDVMGAVVERGQEKWRVGASPVATEESDEREKRKGSSQPARGKKLSISLLVCGR